MRITKRTQTVQGRLILRRGFCWLALSVCLAGCTRGTADGRSPTAAQQGDPSAGIIVGATNTAIADLPPDGVIVSVNGEALTRRGYDALLSSLDKAYRLYNPNRSPNEWEAHRQGRARTLVREFITKQVLVQEARRRGLEATPENHARLKESLELFAKNEGVSVGELADSSDPSLKIAYESAKDQALILTLRQAEFGDRLQVTEADLQAARRRIERYNEVCAQTNALVKARAEAVYERFRAGEDFLKVAQEVTEEKGDVGGVWGEFTRGEIEDAQVRNAAFTLPVGAVSDPFDTDEGLVIIKVLERTGIDSPLALSGATVKLGRIVFLLGELATMPNEKALRQELESLRLAELQRPWLDELQRKARIEFPNGTGFWESKKTKE